MGGRKVSDNKTALNEEQIPTVDEIQEEALEPEEKTLEQAEEAVERDIEALFANAQMELEKQKELALRTMADMENLRRRTRMDVENARKFALDKFVKELVPVLDSMEMGMDAAAEKEASAESIREGLDMTFKLFLDVMEKFDVERIDPAGEKFNPKLHEAMTMVPSPDHESQTVVEVFQKGYVLNDRLVRAARVIVAQ